MRNIEKLRDYFLGKDPQLKETMADNSLRLIGIEGKYFVLRKELLQRLAVLKKELSDKDAELLGMIETLEHDLSAETLARQNADTGLGNRIGAIETWKENTDFVLVSDLTAALANYYTKAQVDALIAAIPTLTYEVVPSLPTTNISRRTIYMVHPSGAEEPDYYNEYLYMGDTSQPYDPDNWELIGNTRIDLTNYYTKGQVDTLFSQMTFSTTLQQDIRIRDGEPQIVGLPATGWYNTGSHEIYFEDEVNPTFYANTMFFYQKDTESDYNYICFLPYTADGGEEQMDIRMSYDPDLNEWVWHGYTIAYEINDLNKEEDRCIPSTKAVYDLVEEAMDYDLLRDKPTIEGVTVEGTQTAPDLNLVPLDQIPTATATGNPINVQDSSNLPPKDFKLKGNATQADTPTPDTPQDIHVVTGDNTVNIGGKNIVNWSTPNFAGTYVTYTFTNDTLTVTNSQGKYKRVEYDITQFYKSNNGKTYYFSYASMTKTHTGTAQTVQLAITSAGGSITYPNITNGGYGNIPADTSDITKVVLQVYSNNSNTDQSGTITIVKPLLELSNSATNYEHYITPTTQLLSLGSIELAKIGTYTDRIFKDSGKWYVEKNIGKLVLNGSENWTAESKRCIVTNIFYAKTFSSFDSNNPLAYCNGFKWGNGTSGTFVYGAFWYTSNGRSLSLQKDETPNADSFKTWLASNNQTVYYVLATPTTTEITDSTLLGQLENILKMHTNKNVTNISIVPTGTNAEPTAEVEYRVDLGSLEGMGYQAGANITITGNTISATDTTYSDFTGTDGLVDGTAGLVPAPLTTDENKYLKSDGTWASVSGGGGTSDYTDLSNKPQINSVTLSGNVALNTLGVASDSTFTGTDGLVAGTKGLVPAPATTDDGKFLKADGTWGTPAGEANVIESISVNNVAQTVVSKNVDISVPVITASTTDLTPGTSQLDTGSFYFVYE